MPLAVLAAHTAHRSVVGRVGRADRLMAAAADLLEGAVREVEAGAGRDYKVRPTSADWRTVQPVKSLEHILGDICLHKSIRKQSIEP